jgi:hypothetical protein
MERRLSPCMSNLSGFVKCVREGRRAHFGRAQSLGFPSPSITHCQQRVPYHIRDRTMQPLPRRPHKHESARPIEVQIVLVFDANPVDSSCLYKLRDLYQTHGDAFPIYVRGVTQRLNIPNPPFHMISWKDGRVPTMVLKWKFDSQNAVCLSSSASEPHPQGLESLAYFKLPKQGGEA